MGVLVLLRHRRKTRRGGQIGSESLGVLNPRELNGQENHVELETVELPAELPGTHNLRGRSVAN
jgi:hypothetical protein